MKCKTITSWLGVMVVGLIIQACNQHSGGGTVSVDPTLFYEDALVGDIAEELCTLSGGTETICYRITVKSTPVDHQAVPWCPETISDGDKAGGIWPDGGKINNVDGAFIKNLEAFYSDDQWKLYRDDGSVRVTDSKEACVAARPNVDEDYQNFCVQCLLSYLEKGMVNTHIIPIKPVQQTKPRQIARTSGGLALNGVNFDPPAPTNAILSARTLTPFDDCGGHIHLNHGYHYHAHTGCLTEVAQEDTHSLMIGHALEGFSLHARLEEQSAEESSLDECRGHSNETRGYHYHVTDPGSNSFINCFQRSMGARLKEMGKGRPVMPHQQTIEGDRVAPLVRVRENPEDRMMKQSKNLIVHNLIYNLA
ncbi:YHYH protein [Acaryochloris marina]|nr:YHYH protein [Acaryochloris marina]